MKSRGQMYGLLYRSRKKGVRISTKNRTVYCGYGTGPELAELRKIRSVRRLETEFGFGIQLTF